MFIKMTKLPELQIEMTKYIFLKRNFFVRLEQMEIIFCKQMMSLFKWYLSLIFLMTNWVTLLERHLLHVRYGLENIFYNKEMWQINFFLGYKDSNSQPFGHWSPLITIRWGLPSHLKILFADGAIPQLCSV